LWWQEWRSSVVGGRSGALTDEIGLLKFMVPGSIAGAIVLVGLARLGSVGMRPSLLLAGFVGTLVALCLNWTNWRGDYDLRRSVDLLRLLGLVVIVWGFMALGSVFAFWALGWALGGVWPGLFGL
jgi:hypothetical protein